MIFDFPTIRYKTVVVESRDKHVDKKTIVTRRPWLRIIWIPSQKTILLGRYRRINFTAEPHPAQHMAAVEAAARGDTEADAGTKSTSPETPEPSSVVSGVR